MCHKPFHFARNFRSLLLHANCDAVFFIMCPRIELSVVLVHSCDTA